MLDRPILVTGAAGFIGFHVARRLLDEGRPVVGLDSLNDYYDTQLKLARLAELQKRARFRFLHMDLADRAVAREIFAEKSFSIVIHLAAQAGIRHSIDHPHDYIDSNIEGFLNLLEGCRHSKCEHLLFASSSSVYGANGKEPFAVTDQVDRPISLYAATKAANELMAHAYSHLYRVPSTALRFFTAYGPWGRPDMAIYLFADAIVAGKPIKLFNNGNMRRDFTYIDDAVEAVSRLVNRAPTTEASQAPFRIYNIGSHRPENIGQVVNLLEKELGQPAIRELLPMQPGDVVETFADISDLERDIGFSPKTSLEEGIHHFVAWYRDYKNAVVKG